ncbi:SdpI family protein [Anaerotignum sp.]|uniref:SdpI family protein n=1 Tax=Anaerotignum sp. TaxID=2039241 RepID=UPI0028AFF2AE|nr:SdpI family protein [Anaerotignum sp.]
MNKKRLAIYFFGALPLIMVCLVYKSLPDLVPMQFQSNGGIRYGEKWQLLVIAGLSFAMGVIMPLMAKIDPRRENYSKFSAVYERIVLIIEVFMAITMGIVILETLYPGRIPVIRVVSGTVGLMFVLLGNMMPKVKSNYFTGIKTPWALSSETVWNKTQRLGGKMFFFGGLVMFLSAFVFPIQMMQYITIGLVFLIVLMPTIMSYVWYQNEMKSLGK